MEEQYQPSQGEISKEETMTDEQKESTELTEKIKKEISELENLKNRGTIDVGPINETLGENYEEFMELARKDENDRTPEENDMIKEFDRMLADTYRQAIRENNAKYDERIKELKEQLEEI